MIRDYLHENGDKEILKIEKRENGLPTYVP